MDKLEQKKRTNKYHAIHDRLISTLDKDTLSNLYYNERKSCADIAKIYSVTPPTIRLRMKTLDLPRRGLSEIRIGKPLSVDSRRKMSETKRKWIDDHPETLITSGITNDGYKWVWVPKTSPFFSMAVKRVKGSRTPWVREHRLVMAQHLGRPLLRTEIVHHKNGNKTDNRIENLELGTHRTHAIITWEDKLREAYLLGYNDAMSGKSSRILYDK